MTCRSGVPTILVAAFVTLFACCEGNRSVDIPDQTQLALVEELPELPELAQVGGAQDLWPFDFGFDATRSIIEAQNGVPIRIDEESAGEEVNGIVTSWEYDGLEFTFYSDPTQDLEFLIAVRISTTSIELGGGVVLGMTQDSLVEIMGAPAVDSGDTLVYFYLLSTIEIEISDRHVAAVTLSRAMP